MDSATIKPLGELSCGVPTEVGMTSATVSSPSYVRYVRYVRYTPLALGLSAFWGPAPSVFCFLFSPPAHYPEPPGPPT